MSRAADRKFACHPKAQEKLALLYARHTLWHGGLSPMLPPNRKNSSTVSQPNESRYDYLHGLFRVWPGVGKYSRGPGQAPGHDGGMPSEKNMPRHTARRRSGDGLLEEAQR